MTQEKIRIIIDGDATRAKEAFSSTNTSMKSFVSNLESAATKMKSIGLKMSLAITAPLILIGKQSLETAMDVIESENLFEVSMGNMADTARNWSEELRYQLGLNEYEVRKQVGVFNVMLKSMGLSEEQAYSMAKGIVQLGYDMASFYNLRPEEAFEKLSSGIVGMPRPLQDLGILINETTSKTWALKEGLVEEGEELDAVTKVLARYGALMEATSAAQGDMARTLESPANQLRIFQEQVEMLKVELGQELIPMFLDVIDKLEPMIKWFSGLNDEQKSMVINLGLVAAAAGPVLAIFGNLVTVVRSLTSGIITLNVATKGALATAAPLVAGYTALAVILLSVAKGLNNVTLGFQKATSGARSWLSVLEELVKVVTLYPPYYGEMIGNAFSRQSGGEALSNQYAPDLGIPIRKGEGIIPPELMRAIKQNRTSYAGVGNTGGGNSINISMPIGEMVIGDRGDADYFAERLSKKISDKVRLG